MKLNDVIVCGPEAAMVLEIHVTIGDAGMIMDCVETLEVNDDGKIVGMKAYWDMSRARTRVESRIGSTVAPDATARRDASASARFSSGRDFGHNVLAMNVESRDSVSLKPAELDEVGQIFHSNGLPISDEELDRQVESFPLAVLASEPRATSTA